MTTTPSTTPSSASPQSAYTDLVTTMRGLGAVLGPAVAARYEAPPAGPSGAGKNPTLDIVLDPRRLALSEAVSAAEQDLRRATRLLGPHMTHLREALARWEGAESDDA